MFIRLSLSKGLEIRFKVSGSDGTRRAPESGSISQAEHSPTMTWRFSRLLLAAGLQRVSSANNRCEPSARRLFVSDPCET